MIERLVCGVQRLNKLPQHQLDWVFRLAEVMPFYRHMGITLTKLRLGTSEINIRVTKGLTQSAGFAHGGVAASLVDSAVGLALCTLLQPRESITTIELKVNFVAPAKPGLLKAKGWTIHKGKRIAVGESEVKDQQGKLIAKGLVTYMILTNRRRPKFKTP
jgi:uncharacterized protein (TIGR00369 family)